MTGKHYKLRAAALQSDYVTYPTVDLSEKFQTCISPATDFEPEAVTWGNTKVLRSILTRLTVIDFSGKEYVEAYLRHVLRRNYKTSTLNGIFTALVLFLSVVKGAGKICLEEITKGDVEAFIEREQDRGLKITSVRTRLVYVQTFLRYGIDEGVVSPDVLGRKIRLQLPEHLPRAMDPEDMQHLLSLVVDVRDRAMILLLLRTGMRIGELLNIKVKDVHIRERRVEIYEGEKNRLGRMVYISDDAVDALKSWFKQTDHRKEFLFYGRRRDTLHYTAARARFEKYLIKAELTDTGYTLHSLRHTFASELLNAGMRLECLQVLLGHHSIEETRRYARLTDVTREEEYFRAMSRIERGEIDGHYRRDHELETLPEEEERFTQYR
jgi:integrase/recombinase XerD